MRLQLICLLSMPAIASAQVAKVDLRSSAYQDNDRTFIDTSSLSASANPSERFGLKAHYLVDVVSSASVDVISAASPTRFLDIRHDVGGGASYADGTRTANVGYAYSGENDWWSHTGFASFSHDLANHQGTIGAGGSFTHNIIGRRDDITFRKFLDQGSGNVDITFVPSRTDLVSLGYTFIFLSGFQSSPYRFVFWGNQDPGLRLGAWESMPDTRIRHAIGFKWNHHLFKDSALRTHARFYADDWGILSGTAGVEWVIGFGSAELAPYVRGYVQKSADFYRPSYGTRQRFMSADKETASLADVFGGLRFGWRKQLHGAFDEIRIDAKASALAFAYFDFPRLPYRIGFVGELGFGAAF